MAAFSSVFDWGTSPQLSYFAVARVNGAGDAEVHRSGSQIAP